jgi:DNA-binding beta-propeller fold protein YncE
MPKKKNCNAGLKMVRRIIKYTIALGLLCACKHRPNLALGDYPKDVGNIIITKCATSGCHNNQSAAGAGGLNLTTWNDMFAGAKSGAVTIPYRPDFSTLCYYTNTDTSLGVALIPTMPEGQPPLTKQEYLTLRNWIAAGAQNAKGEVKFADNPNRKKIYVLHRMCDVVTVFDAATLLQMRYIDVGVKQLQDYPYSIKVSPDGKYWYVSFFAQSNIIQQYDAVDDKLIGNITLGDGIWTSFTISPNGRYGYFVDNSSPGKIVCADLRNRRILNTYTFNNTLHYPYGISYNKASEQLYIGTTAGNFIYTIDMINPSSPILHQIPLDGSAAIRHEPSVEPIQLLTLENYCYIICQNTHDLKILNTLTKAVIKSIQLPAAPACIDYSEKYNKLFISCTEDITSFTPLRGSICVIDINTLTLQKNIYSGYQPYGLAVDDASGLVTVANANLNSAGPSPHHTSNCGGRNGNVSFIDMGTLSLVSGKRSEVAVFPTSIGIRH